MVFKFLQLHGSVFFYGASLAILLLFIEWLEWRLIVVDYTLELYAGAIAILFTGLGIWLANQLTRPRINTVVVEKQVLQSSHLILNETEVARLRLSKRELEVLQLMAEGLSNLQIADQLFISLNTVKTHSSKIFEKLEVKRRTQAVDMGRKMGIIF
jgi:DNA-binding CsgD family transcriptional regulator